MLRVVGFIGVSLGLHVAAFAGVALLPSASLQALDLQPHNVEVEFSFIDAEGQGDSQELSAQPFEPRKPSKVTPVETALVHPEATAASEVPNEPQPLAGATNETVVSDANEPRRGGAATGSGGSAAQSLQTLAKAWLKSVGRLIFSNAVRHYPAPARQAHLEGTVALAITIDSGGRIIDVAIKRSSGHAELDSAALSAVQAIHRVPPPPALLNWQPRALTLPIVYKLN